MSPDQILNELVSKLRIKISNYHPNERDQIRRNYLQSKPCQPVDHDFPQSQFGKTKRQFNPLGSKNILVGWNIALRKMLHIVYIVIFFDLILVIKEGETHLLLKDSEIGKRKGRNYRITLGIKTAHII